jgi:hypothetical protein
VFDDQLATIPALPPRSGSLPGMRIGADLPRGALLLFAVFILFFAILPLSILGSEPGLRLRMGPSLERQGTVREVSDVPGCRNSGARRIIYTFQTDPGHELRGADNLCEESPYYSVRVSDAIMIRYLARDPSVNAVATPHADEPPIAVFIFPFFFPLVMLAVFSSLYLPQLRETWRARRLYKSGILTQGRVVFVKKRQNAFFRGWNTWQNNYADVYVACQRPDGQTAEIITWSSNDWLLHQLAPGATVHVLHARNQSGRGVLLEEFIR